MPLPPAQPAYVLRGHGAQIHAVTFMRSNTRLVTGDADGWVVVWSTATKRPVSVWRAHEGTLLGLRSWGEDRLITHGKDYKLIVWRLSPADESSMSTVLPIDTAPPEPRRQPWMLHIIMANTMNFCSFAACVPPSSPGSPSPGSPSPGSAPSSSPDEQITDSLLIAVPNVQTSETVDIFHLPTCARLHTVPGPAGLKTGMVMAIALVPLPTLTVVAAFESGHSVVSRLVNTPDPSTGENEKPMGTWETLYVSQAHTQPVLSLAAAPGYFITSGADAVVAKHPIPDALSPSPTSSSSSSQNQKEKSKATINTPTESTSHLPNMPLRITRTGHAGQQSLSIRADLLIFATAGWDARVRVYETRSMRELAVLKWHREGCYAVAFADVLGKGGDGEDGEDAEEKNEGDRALAERNTTRTLGVREERLRRATEAHWIAVGGKDGKVSLWDIY